MALKRKNIIFQVIGCILFMFQPVLLPSRPIDHDGIFSNELLKDYLANAFLIAFFYTNYFFLIPRFYFRKHYFVYSLFIAIALFLIVIFPSILFKVDFAFEPGHHHHSRNVAPSLFNKFRHYFSDVDHQAFLFIAVVFFSLLLKVRSRWYTTEKARQEAEINYLFSQVNPHFLFNALNSIYALTIKEKATDSAKSILKLSGLMRYIVTENRKDFVPLQNEINCIIDFIDLQKLRLADNIRLTCSIQGDFSDKKIAPLLLIPFIENAFKHGVNPDEDSQISIQINTNDHELTLQVENNKVSVNNDTIGRSGLGIENTQKRLKLLYPEKHVLKITEDDNFYNIILTLFF